jgi:hypothetical protein
MDPFEAGEYVLRGIRDNDLYILSHPEFEQGIRDRSEALLASIPLDVNPPKARLEAEREALSNRIYTGERDRRIAATRERGVGRGNS